MNKIIKISFLFLAVDSEDILASTNEFKQMQPQLESLQKQLQKKGQTMVEQLQRKTTEAQQKLERGEMSPKQQEEKQVSKVPEIGS